MRFADTLRLALRNLRESVLRTALTSLGVAIGVASLVGMVSFGVALQDQITGSMGFGAFSVADVMQSQKRAFIIIDLLLALVGSIALSVASLGIVNTMVMSILERTREIGVKKAIGADDGDVRRVFLIEAALIGLAGGVAGVALGWGVGRLINIGANMYLERQGVPAANLFLIPWWLTAGGIAFSVLVGLIAGGFPAARAARLDPIQALRHD